MYTKKTPKGESIDKTPYSSYYPHSTPLEDRKWKQDFRQFVSIDPARVNVGFRIERRHRPTDEYPEGLIETLAYNKVSIEETLIDNENVGYNNIYNNLTNFLDDHEEYYDDCHYVIVERQVQENYKCIRVSQHIISYFSIKLKDKPLCPSIIEVAPQLKGKMLGVPKGVVNKELKKWSVEKTREILTARGDTFALEILNFYKKKADDLSDTLIQIEGIIRYWKENDLQKEAYTYVNIIAAPKKLVLPKKNEEKLVLAKKNEIPKKEKLVLPKKNNT